MKKSLCIDARMLRHSGIGTVIRNLVPFLAQEFHTTLILPESSSEFDFESVDVARIKASSGIYSLREQVEIPLKVPKTDLLWVPHYNIPVFPTRAQKLVVTIHDVFHLDFANTLSVFKQLYSRSLMQIIGQKADGILTVSQFSKGRILAHLPLDPARIKVVYNGIDWKQFSNPGPSQSDPKPFPQPYYLWVGNVKPHKNLGLIVQSLQQLSRRNFPLPHIVLAGKLDGLITRELEALEEIQNNPVLKPQFHFLGEVSDAELIGLYQNAEALLFPSLYEGFGLPPLEALACGMVSVVSRIEVLEEIYENAAIFVDPFDSEELTKIFEGGISKIAKENLLKNGQELKKNLTWEKTALAYIEAFNQIAAN